MEEREKGEGEEEQSRLKESLEWGSEKIGIKGREWQDEERERKDKGEENGEMEEGIDEVGKRGGGQGAKN